MATSGRRAQEPVRGHGSSKCSKHYGKEVVYVCETCDVLACMVCATKQHKGHELEGLSDVIPRAKQKLQQFIQRAEGIEIPRLNGKFQKVEEELSKNKQQFQKQVSEIKKKNETLKKELDKIADTMVKTCYGMKHQNSETLLNHQKELQSQLDKLSSKIQDVKATLQSGNDVLVFDTSHVIPSLFKDIPTPSCGTAEFIQAKVQMQQLEHLLGEMNITDHYQPSLSLSQPRDWRVVSEFKPNELHYIDIMHAAGDKVWLSYRGSNSILSVNKKGEAQQTINTDVIVRDFCVSPNTDNIWYCSDDSSVREVKDNRETIKFITNTWPQCICVTRDDHVLVGCYKEIVKYTQTGQEVCSTSGGTPSVVRTPYHMSECPLTRHIAVVAWDFTICGGDDKPFVSILNVKLQLLHTYRGEVSGQQPPPRPFDPRDVCYTSTGELVITDSNNKTVVLVTGTGSYLQTLYTNSESEPRVVCVHSGALWVSLYNKKVKVLKNN